MKPVRSGRFSAPPRRRRTEHRRAIDVANAGAAAHLVARLEDVGPRRKFAALASLREGAPPRPGRAHAAIVLRVGMVGRGVVACGEFDETHMRASGRAPAGAAIPTGEPGHAGRLSTSSSATVDPWPLCPATWPRLQTTACAAAPASAAATVFVDPVVFHPPAEPPPPDAAQPATCAAQPEPSSAVEIGRGRSPASRRTPRHVRAVLPTWPEARANYGKPGQLPANSYSRSRRSSPERAGGVRIAPPSAFRRRRGRSPASLSPPGLAPPSRERHRTSRGIRLPAVSRCTARRRPA